MSPRVRAVAVPLIPLVLLLTVTAVQHLAAASHGSKGHEGFITPLGVMLQGANRGLITALIAVGIALVYRTNNVINFAAAELGLVPATLTVLLVVDHGWPYYPTLLVGLVGSVLVGVVVEFVFVRRFFSAPRLILTVATLGIQQVLLAGVFLLIKGLASDTSHALPTPVGGSFEIGLTVFKGDDIAILVVAPLVLAAVGVFLRFSTFGKAIRAAAERSDRAAMLGIPVRRLHSVGWTLAAVLSFVGVMLYAHNSGGLPRGYPLGPEVLLLALAAAVIGRFDHIPTIVLTSVGLGVLNASILYDWPDPIQRDFGLALIVIVGVLFVRQHRDTRVRAGTVSSWDAAREVRPIPPELRDLTVVKWTRIGLMAAAAAFVVALPFRVAPSRVTLATTIAIYAIVGVSLVILTGWAGQVSLGHLSLMALGAAAAGTVTSRYHWDLSLALLAGAAVGALAMVLVGLPAIRAGGLALGITTLALSLGVPYLLNSNLAPWFLKDNLPNFTAESTKFRPQLFGRLSVDDNTHYYFLVLVVLGFAISLARALRSTRAGRVLVGLRENDRAAASFGIGARGPYVTALIASGMLAGVAGALSVEQSKQFFIGDFEFFKGLGVFAMVVVGGLGSIGGAIVGAVYFRGITYFVPADAEWLRFLSTGIGLLAVLMLLPGGLGAFFGDLRDGALRWIARRHGIRVPSLVADTRVVDDEVVAADAPVAMEQAKVMFQRRAGLAKLLVVRNVDVHYDKVQVLFGVDFEVDQGEIVALLGTNGAGKSTLLKTICGLAKATNGAVVFDGRDATNAPPDQIAARGVVLMPGGQGTFPGLSVADNLELACWTQRHDKAHVAAARARVLELFPVVKHRWHEPAGNLSGGQQQMLSLGMAFVMKPQLLMIDELSLGLAPVVVEQLLGIVREMSSQGTTIILVEQSVNLALQLAETAYFMEKGEIRFHGPTRALLERPDILRSVFLDGAASVQGHPNLTGTSRSSELSASGAARGRVAAGMDRPTPQTDGSKAHDGESIGDVLVVDEVTKVFGGLRALDLVTFAVHSGDIVGFVGPNGAGKTTLFDAIGGFIAINNGSIVLRVGDTPRDVTLLPAYARAWLGLGRSFQNGRLFPSLSVAETLAIALERSVEVRDPVAAALRLPAVAQSERKVAARVDELLELTGIQDFAHKLVRELSTGSKRIVDLACMLAHSPSVLMLDEPSSGIAQRESEALGPLLLQIREQTGASLLVIEHDVPLLVCVADRLIAMDLGEIVADGAPYDVVNDERVIASYLGSGVAVARSNVAAR